MSTVLANPAEMIAHGAPRVIHNEAELEMYTDALFRLTALENPSGSEVEAIELLTLLVESFEQEHYPIPRVIRFQLCDLSFNNRISRNVNSFLNSVPRAPSRCS